MIFRFSFGLKSKVAESGWEFLLQLLCIWDDISVVCSTVILVSGALEIVQEHNFAIVRRQIYYSTRINSIALCV